MIHAAWPNFAWPGAASVMASEVHIRRAIADHSWQGGYLLEGVPVKNISAFLSAEEEWSPKPLAANDGISFIGSYVLGLGFTVNEAEANSLITKEPSNSEALFPYLNGEDLNSHPTQKASRWIINFWDWPLDRAAVGSWVRSDEKQKKRWLQVGSVPVDFSGRVAEDFPDLLKVIVEKVKPERQRLNANGKFALREPLPTRWWHYADKRPALYHAAGSGAAFAKHPDGWIDNALNSPKIFAQSRVSKFIAPCERPLGEVWAERVVLFVGDVSLAGLLLLSIHEVWVRKNAATFETRLTYTPSDSFETQPLPPLDNPGLRDVTSAFLSARHGTMVELNIGLTDFYNLFHDPKMRGNALDSLRSIYTKLDSFISSAYGWSDLELGHGFHSVPYLPENDRIRYTIDEPARLELLRRLSRLNRERWQAEQDEALAAVHDVEAARLTVKTPRGNSGPALKLLADPKQPGLF